MFHIWYIRLHLLAAKASALPSVCPQLADVDAAVELSVTVKDAEQREQRHQGVCPRGIGNEGTEEAGGGEEQHAQPEHDAASRRTESEAPAVERQAGDDVDEGGRQRAVT